ncbi:MAG: NPCBM/NEW2 domain-containing protein [Pirellulaceae bacterium]|nr:NPCBM/NEW2 domain-containing protein [Pirellulaceae bacterium]
MSKRIASPGARHRRGARRLSLEPLEHRLPLHGGVLAVVPWNGQAEVEPTATIRAAFDFDLDPATVTGDTVQLWHPAGQRWPAEVTYDAASRQVTLRPTQPLADVGDFYRAIILGGDQGVRELDTGHTLEADFSWHFMTQAPEFQEDVLLSGLVQPMAIDFAADGRVFVAEKGGVIKMFSDLGDPEPAVLADLRANVFNFWDRGLLGLALHPRFPLEPYLYVLYAYDYDPAHPQDFPRWGDATSIDDSCPDPPGANTAGCVVTGRLSRLAIGADGTWDGVEHVLVQDWGQQFPSHSLGSLAFGADGALYASAGDGASFSFADYGQVGNPLGDPPLLAGSTLSAPTAEGGALRAQDVLSREDPLTLSGTVIRIDPATGQGLPGNPLFDDPDANARRLVAHGFRNPFRFAVRPGTSELWVGDVGWSEWEEINVIRSPADSRLLPHNFGWPAFEGTDRQGAYDAADLNLLERLYNDPHPDAHQEPYFAYRHLQPLVPGDTDAAGGSSLSGLAFSEGGNLPPAFDGALFFADFSRQSVYVMFPGEDGQPDPRSTAVVLPEAAGPVQLRVAPNGDLVYVDLLGGSIRRVRFTGIDKPPVAVAAADRTYGGTPLQVRFDASASRDSNPDDRLTYAWDLDGDGQLDDSTAVNPKVVYPRSGVVTVTLRVTDSAGLSSTDTLQIQAGNSPPQVLIDSPPQSLNWQVGQTVSLSGRGLDERDGMLPLTALQWEVILHHCPDRCHTHPVTSFSAASASSFPAPDHEWPALLEVRLTATDSWGLRSSASQMLVPATVDFQLRAEPAGLQLSLGNSVAAAPYTLPVIVGSNNSLAAPSPQLLDERGYRFIRWSDGGARSHNVLAGESSASFAAEYLEIAPAYLSDLPVAGTPVNGWGPLERDGSNGEQAAGDGGPITLDGVAYAKGLGVHAPSELVYRLDQKFARFVADVGVDDEVGERGTVTFEVWADGARIHDSGLLRGNSPASRIDLNVAGVDELKLVVTGGTDGADSDHGNWAGARLLARDENDPPASVRNLGAQVAAGGQLVLSDGELLYADNVQPPANVVYRIKAAPTRGHLERTDAPGLPIGDFSQNDVQRGRIAYVHTGQDVGPDRFEFEIGDGQGNWLDQQSFTIEVVEAVYISDLPFAEPPANGWGPVERDRSNGDLAGGDGRPLTLGGVTYAKGLGVHAASEIQLALGGNYQRFLADVGVDDEVGAAGSVRFQVWADGQLRLESRLLRGSDAAERLAVDVLDVERLTLRVTDGGDDPGFDHADWADARLIPIADHLPPVEIHRRGTLVAPAGQVLLTADDLAYADNAQPASRVVYRVSEPPAHGQLVRVDAQDVPVDLFTQQDLNEGRILYVHGGTSQPVDRFRFDVDDSRGNVLAGQVYEVQVAGVQWLSDLPLAEPAVNGWGPVERDRSNGEQAAGDGNTLTLSGLTYGKGLGVHAWSELTFELAGGYRRLVADLGVDQEASGAASVTFEVWLDGVRRFESGVLTPASVTRRLDLDLTDVALLRLVVTDAGDGPGWDHADWADARLLPNNTSQSTGPGSS